MKTRDGSPGGNKWHAVAIRTGRNACAAALELQNKRFLSRDAPPLPLKNCMQPGHCSCTYAHHSDRRQGEGRRAEENDRFQAPKKPNSERRRGPDRRRPPED